MVLIYGDFRVIRFLWVSNHFSLNKIMLLLWTRSMNIIKIREQLRTNITQNYRINYFVTLCSFLWEQNNTFGLIKCATTWRK